MKLIRGMLICALSLLPADLAAQVRATPPSKPKLVVLLAVDQFRYDYLTRFQGRYTSGLGRLLKAGAVFTQAHLEHYPSVTAVGHATMLTGAYPAHSGIIGNDWYDRASGKSVTSVSDPSVSMLGGTEGAGASPRRLLVTTIGDELKIATRGQSRVIGMSLKDRSAILMAGHSADGAYWYDSRTGNFVSSTYYFSALPRWVSDYNESRPADRFAGRPWASQESKPSDGPSEPFRVLPAQPGPQLYSAIGSTPFGNDLLVDLAKRALAAEQLGTRGVTDLLAISFSSNDSVGHDHGPDSPQVEDTCEQTDRQIGELLQALDRHAGLAQVLLILTADHGVAPVPEEMQKRKMPGGRISGKDLFGPIESALAAAYGPWRWILATAGSSPYLNYDLIRERNLDPAQVRATAVATAMGAPRVAKAFTRDQLEKAQAGDDPLSRRVLRGFHSQRSGDLEILLEPYWIRSASGTTHGTPYSYDTHIPLVFMGPGIRPGRYHQPVALNDLAPTLAALLGVETPSAAAGRVLEEMLAR